MRIRCVVAEAAGEGGAKPKTDPGYIIVNLVVPMVLLFFVFYMLLIRPQKQKESQRKDMLGRLKKKDHVTTIGGVHGQVVEITEDTVILRIDSAKDVKVKMQRSAIAGLVKSSEAGEDGE